MSCFKSYRIWCQFRAYPICAKTAVASAIGKNVGQIARAQKFQSNNGKSGPDESQPTGNNEIASRGARAESALRLLFLFALQGPTVTLHTGWLPWAMVESQSLAPMRYPMSVPLKLLRLSTEVRRFSATAPTAPSSFVTPHCTAHSSFTLVGLLTVIGVAVELAADPMVFSDLLHPVRRRP